MILLEFAAAFVGTIAFALLFSVPKNFYPVCGLTGGCGWTLYSLLHSSGLSAPEATFFATVLVVCLSRVFAIYNRCPVTVFLIAGIFPLVPGINVYWTAYYIVSDDLSKAGEYGFATLKIAACIVLGILLVFGLPQKLFRLPPKAHNRKERNK